MVNYRLQVVKISESKYNIKRHYDDPKEIEVDTFDKVINTIYRFRSEKDVLAKVPALIGLTEEEEEAIQETRKRILRVLELEKERERILRVSSELEKLVHPSLKKFKP